MSIVHLCLFPLSFFSHIKHSIASRLVMAAHRPWTKLSVNTFTVSLDFFELPARPHEDGLHESTRCMHDASPRAMVRHANHIITIFYS
jgi:hypothetical protein